jgi:FtsX-like permease family
MRRMLASRLLLSAVFAAVLVSSAVVGALVTLSLRTLPATAQRELEQSAGTSIDVTGQGTLAQVATDTSGVRTSLRAAFGAVPVALDTALWSEPLRFPGTLSGQQVLGQAAAMDAISGNARLIAGSWPAAASAGGPVPVAAPLGAAGALRLTVGELLTVRNDYTQAPLRLRITGLYLPRQPTAAYWTLSLLGTTGSGVQYAVRTFGPLVTTRSEFESGRLSVIAASWHATPALGRIQLAAYAALARRISAAEQNLGSPLTYGGLAVTTSLPQLLADTELGLAAARSLLLVSALQVLLLAAASVALAARLLAGQREEEIALLSARGMARRQLAGRATAEAAMTIVPAVLGAVAGSLLASLIRPAAQRPAAGTAQIPLFVWGTAGAITIGATLIMLWPVLSPLDPVTAGVRRGRHAALATTVLAGADIALIAVAAIAVWQLRLYAEVPQAAAASIGVYPVLAVAPALALAGAALIPLRALPLAASALDRLSARTRRLAPALASWQLSRRPIRQSGPALLVILAVAIGTIALAEHQSWHRSVVDQADFTAGALVRADLATPLPLSDGTAITTARGVAAAMPASRIVQTGGAQLLAIGTRQAGATVLLRPDLAPMPAAQLWRSITPAGRAPGLVLPGRPARLEITARLSLGVAAGIISSMPATVYIQDADGIVYAVPAGELSDHQRRLVATLSPGHRADYPLRLLGVSLTWMLPTRELPPPATVTITVSGLAVSPAATGGFRASFVTGAGLGSWQAAGSIPASYQNPSSVDPPAVESSQTTGGALSLTISPGFGSIASRGGLVSIPAQLTLTAPVRLQPIPAIATQPFLTASLAHVGSRVQVEASGVSVTARIVAAVSAFPSAGAGGSALIVDQATLQDQLLAQSAAPVPATEWWLRTTGPVRLPAGAVATSAAALAAAMFADPLSRVQQATLLAVAVAAALLAALGFAVSVAASMRERRTQSALLGALGVSRAERTRQLCLEQLMLSAPAAVAGVLLGAGLAWLLIPAVTRTGVGLPPFPPPLLTIPLGPCAALVLTATAIPVVAAAGTVVYQPDPAAQLRTAETA